MDDAAALPDGRWSRCTGPGWSSEGTDVTVATYGPMVATALEAARIAAEEGTSLEVVDLRSLSPIDFETLEASVRKTGRLVVAHEAPVFGGPRGRDRGPDLRALLLPPRGARAPGRGSPRPTRRPAGATTSCPTPTASSTRWTGASTRERAIAQLPPARPGRGADRGRGRGLARGRGRHGDAEPGPREVETEKAVVELPSPYAGTVVELLAGVGETVAVGAPLVALDTGDGGADGATRRRCAMLVGYGPSEAPAEPPPRPAAGTATRADPDGTPARRVTRPSGAAAGALHGAAERGRPGPGRRATGPAGSSPARTWPRTSKAWSSATADDRRGRPRDEGPGARRAEAHGRGHGPQRGHGAPGLRVPHAST